MPKTPIYKARANKAYEKRRKEAGIVRLTVYVPAVATSIVKEVAKDLREKFKKDGSLPNGEI